MHTRYVTVKNSLLALLCERPHYGYELRQEFESRTGSTWPLNIGQVYTTLDRLHRDGLAESSDGDADGRKVWHATPAGRDVAATWLARPVSRPAPSRDELAMKLAIAASLDGVDVTAIIQTQREATARTLQDLTRTKAAGGDPASPQELAWLLVVDSMIFQAEAEIRWLDHSEQRLSKIAAPQRTTDRVPHPAADAGGPETPAITPTKGER
jgi:DNA-binding PadR family transcriptional regulator